MMVSSRHLMLWGMGCALACTAATAQPACPPGQGRLGVLLGEDALASLRNLRESTFTRAYLVSLVAGGDTSHAQVKAARRAIADPAAPLPPAGTLLAALETERACAEDRQRAAELFRDGDLAGSLAPVLGEVPDDWPRAAAELAERDGRLREIAAYVRLAFPGEAGLIRHLRDVTERAGLAVRWREWDACQSAAAALDDQAEALRVRLDDLRAVLLADPAAEVDTLRFRRDLDELEGRRAGLDCGQAPAAPDDTNDRLDRVRQDVAALNQGRGRELRVDGVRADGLASATMALRGAADLEPLTSSPAATGLPQAAGLPANVFVALTEFAIERVRDELVMDYLGGLAGNLGVGWAADVFPETLRLTSGVAGATSTDFGLASWRAALVTDLHQLPLRALRSDSLREAVLRRCAPACAGGVAPATVRRTLGRVRVGVGLVEHLRSGERPLDLLADLPAEVDLADLQAGDPLGAPLADAFEVTSRLAHDLRLQDVALDAPALPPYILSARTLRQAGDGHRTVYVRLLFEGVATPGSASEVRALASTAAATVASITDLLAGVAALAEAPPETPVAARVRTAGQLATSALAIPVTVAEGLAAAGQAPDLAALAAQWRGAADVLTLVDAGNATAALTRTLTLYRELTGQPVPVSAEVLTAATLAASLAEAETGDDMVRAFRASALPSGSYRARRAGRGARYAINLYPGLVVGREWIVDDGVGDPALSLGLSLPVGVNVNVDRTVSLFVSAVDLGALLSYRVGGGDVSSAPSVSVQDVFAPGLSLLFGLPRSPLTIALTTQFMPSLRRVEAGEDGMSAAPDQSVLRSSVGVVLDLPVLNLSGRR